MSEANPIHMVALTDDELTLLDGRCSERVQAEIDAAKRRVHMRSSGLTVRQSDLIAEMVDVAREQGELRWTRKPIRVCRICGTDAGYHVYKSGPRRGEKRYDKPKTMSGIDMDPSFVVIHHRARLGGCMACMNELLSHIRSTLHGVSVQAPVALLGEDAPRWVKRRNRKCGGCGWEGHEGQMKMERTMMGDGWFPSRCPSCDAGGGFSRTVGHVDGFVLEPAS